MAPLKGDSTTEAVAGVLGTNSAAGAGVVGQSNDGRGMSGWSVTNYGVTGDSNKFPGVRGTSVSGRGVEGWSTSAEGVWGISTTGDGVFGTGHRGVVGVSTDFVGVYGQSSDPHNAGVMGVNDVGWGVTGRSAGNTGVSGESTRGVGVHGIGGLLAGLFEGAVKITGELFVQGNVRVALGGDIMLLGADCAEHFDMVGDMQVAPGTVLVIGKEGALEESSLPYDRRVAGVVSGAGQFRPGIILDKQELDSSRQPIALIGKVYCKVDADIAPIEIGDLLTTSPTPGHAMKAQDPSRAFGALLGKALRAMPDGQGLIPVLVALQ
jgi:hypothetical protein